MIRITAFAGALLCLFASPLSAAGLHPRCNIDFPCQVFGSKEITLRANKNGHKSTFFASEEITLRSEKWTFVKEKTPSKSFGLSRAERREARRLARGQQLYRAMPFGMPIERRRLKIEASSFEGAKINTGLVAPLQTKLASIQSACPGTAAISGVRHTYVAGTRRISLHASGKAVDVRGNYRCIYAQLKGWPGGYSTDAGRVHHIHISIGGREDGIRFAHGGHKHRHHRYASAGR